METSNNLFDESKIQDEQKIKAVENDCLDNIERIKVIDGYPGVGKTSMAIQIMNESKEDQRFIFVTPYLSEVERVIKSCPNKNFIQPSVRGGHGVKREHLLKLIRERSNIATTHALFQNINQELIEALRLANYTLILDEIFEVIEPLNIYKDIPKKMSDKELEDNIREDISSLIKRGYVSIQKDYRVKWIAKEALLKYEFLRELADRDLIYFINNSLLIWSFPVEIFREGIFDEIFILTYQFENQVQAYYYKFFNVCYSKWHVEKKHNKYHMIKTENNQHELEWKNRIRNLIHIIDNPKLNRIGDVYKDINNHSVKSALSKTWYDNNIDNLPQLRNITINYFRNIVKAKSEDKYWTTFVEYKNKIQNKFLSRKHFVALNARAVNDYGNRHYLAYLVNRYLLPHYVSFFSKKDIKIDQDKIALSELIQWMFRSAIRNGEEIWIYIPSQRMRTLLINFLEGKEIIF